MLTRALVSMSVALFASAAYAETKVTYDLGASTGSTTTATGEVTYTEANLGVNLFLGDYISWRNAGFSRFQTGVENVYGLDTSLRLHLTAGEKQSSASLTLFGGPGYRFVSKGDHVPFAEGGLVFRVGGLSLGGGAKVLANSMIHPGAKDETQYFLILAGGGTL